MRCLAVIFGFLACLTAFAQTSDPIDDQLNALYVKARDLMNQDKKEEALQVYHQGLEIAERENRVNHSAKFHFGIGQYYYRQNVDDKAEEECKLAIALDPSLDRAHALLGYIYRKQKRFDEAEKELIAGSTFELWKADTLLKLGLTYDDKGDRQKAFETIKKASEAGPDEVLPLVWLTRYYFAEKQYDDAINSGEKALAHAQEKDALAMLHDFLGKSYFALHKNEEAEKHFVAELKNIDDNDWKIEVLSLLSQIYSAKNDAKNLAEVSNQILDLNPKDISALISLSLCFSSKQDYQKAVELAQKALDYSDAQTDPALLSLVYYHIGANQYLLNQYDLAEKNLEKALNSDRSYIRKNSHRYLGIIKQDSGEYDAALNHFNEAEKIDPADPDVAFAKAKLFERMKNPSEAEKWYLRTIELNTTFAAWQAYANLLYDQSRWEEAEKAFEKAHGLQPEEVDCLYRIAGIQWLQMDYLKAMKTLERVKEIAPQNERTYWKMGIVLKNAGKIQNAEGAFRKSLEMKKTIDGYVNFVQFLVEQERYPEAMQLLDEAIRENTTNGELLCKRASVFHSSARDEEAIAAYQEAMDEKPSAGCRVDFARLLSSQNENDAAIEQLELAKKTDPSSTDVYMALGDVLFSMGKVAEADSAYGEAIKITDGYWERSQYAQFFYNQTRYAEAEQQLRISLNKNPNDYNSLELLSNVLQRLGRYEESIEIAQKALLLLDQSGSQFRVEFAFIANAYSYLGRYSDGLDLLKKTLADSEAISSTTGRKWTYQAILWGSLADLYAKQGEYPSARDAYQKALDIALPRSKGYWHRYLGDQEKNLGNYDLALQHYLIAIKPATGASQRFYAEVHENMGEAYKKKDEYQQAIDSYEKGLVIARRSNLTGTQMDILADLVNAYRTIGMFDQEENSFREFLELLQKLPEKDRDEYLEETSRLYTNHGDLEKSLECDQAHLDRLRDQNRPTQLADIYDDLGYDYETLGRYDEAIQHYKKALELREKLSNRPGVASTQREIGSTYYEMGDFEEARKWLNLALKNYSEMQRRDKVAETSIDLAALEDGLGNLDEAIRMFQQAYSYYEQVGFRLGQAMALNNEAYIWEDKEDYKKALEIFQKSLALKQNVGNILYSITGYNGIGRQHIFLKNYREAEGSLQTALDLARKAKSKERESWVQQSFAELNMKQSKWTEAREMLLKISEFYPPGTTDWKYWLLLRTSQQKLNQDDEALDSLKKCIALVEKYRKAAKTSQQQRLFLDRYREAYRMLIQLLISKGDLDQAHEYIEREKIAEFEENNSGRPLSFGNTEKDEAFAKGRTYQVRDVELEREIFEESGKPHPDEEVISNLKSLKGAIDREFVNYLDDLRDQFPDVWEQLKGDPRSLRAIVNSLPDGVVILQPVLLPDRIAILIYSNAGATKQEYVLQKGDNVEEAIGLFLDRLRYQSDIREVLQSASQLYDWFIRPVQPYVTSAKLLVVSPSSVLRQIPFQALYDAAEKKYLIEKIPIVNLALLKQLDLSVRTLKQLQVFALGDPDGTLPNSAKQVKDIGQNIPGTKYLLGEEATLESLKWRESDNSYNVLLFATHAKLNDLEPRKSFIQLAMEEKLFYDDIPQFSPFWPRLRLVVLSACETAVALKTSKSVMDSLAENLDLIGIHSVVASLWQVPDPSTAQLMTEFFQRLKNDESAANALQNAEIALIRSDQYSHPFHWAPFILLGDWR